MRKDSKKIADKVALIQLRKKLSRLGAYQVKSSSIGFWVEGVRGYKVISFMPSEYVAIKQAIAEIETAKSYSERPIWMFQ